MPAHQPPQMELQYFSSERSEYAMLTPGLASKKNNVDEARRSLLVNQKNHQSFWRFEEDYLFQPPWYETRLKEVADSLAFPDDVARQTALNLATALVEQGKINFTVSQTGDRELLIYTQVDSIFRNLVIDADGDVDFLYVDNQHRQLAYHRMFYREDGTDYHEVAALL